MLEADVWCRVSFQKVDFSLMPRGFCVPSRRFDGVRGARSMQGWWITLEEGKERACGHEQWWVGSSSNTFFGCDRSKWKLCSPVDVLNNVKSNWKLDKKCVWLCSNKDMHVGDWGIGSKGEWVESGLGVKYNVFNLNFAYLIPSGSGINRNPLSNTFRFTLLFEFDELKKEEAP